MPEKLARGKRGSAGRQGIRQRIPFVSRSQGIFHISDPCFCVWTDNGPCRDLSVLNNRMTVALSLPNILISPYRGGASSRNATVRRRRSDKRDDENQISSSDFVSGAIRPDRRRDAIFRAGRRSQSALSQRFVGDACRKGRVQQVLVNGRRLFRTFLLFRRRLRQRCDA